jgi:hypothetical protein
MVMVSPHLKSFTVFQPYTNFRWVFTFLLFVNIYAGAFAQGKTTGSKTIAITIATIDYDNANLLKLRETIKLNMKVKSVSPSYAGKTAKLSVQYNGIATDLWDELPQAVRQPFVVMAIDDGSISLQLSNQKASASNTTTTSAKNEENCVQCNYYKNCNFDTTVSFDGIIYRGYKTGGQKGFYYYCSKGSLLRKYTGSDKQVYTQVLFKSNETPGTSWSYPVDNNRTYNHVMIAKGLAVKVAGVLYNDVIIVYNNYLTAFRNDYYAKDIGIVKSDSVEKNYDPMKAAGMKGKVDQSIAGIWKHHNTVVDMNLFYKFNSDGTYEYYAGAIHPVNQMPKGKCYWRINGNVLELYTGEWSDVAKASIEKKNDPATGKPMLVIQTGTSEKRAYTSEDAKAAWK